MKKETNRRLSSIELLRIISMIMIVAYHWQLHGNHDRIIYSPLSDKQFFSFAFGSWGALGVDVFFIISSYFLLRSKYVKLDRLIPFILKVSIYGTCVLLLANALGIVAFSAIETAKSLLGVFAYQYWFLTVYVVVYCLHPLFNRIIESLSKKYYSFVIAVLLYTTYIIGFVFVNEFIGRLACGVTIYFLVGYLEKYPEMNLFRKHSLLLSVGGGLAILAIECLLSYLGMKFMPGANSAIKRIQITQSPAMLVVGCAVFYSALKLHMADNRIINFVGKNAAGAYLLHGGSSFIKDYLWDGLFKAGHYYQTGTLLQYIIVYIVCVLLLLSIGCIVEFAIDSVLRKAMDRASQTKVWQNSQAHLKAPYD